MPKPKLTSIYRLNSETQKLLKVTTKPYVTRVPSRIVKSESPERRLTPAVTLQDYHDLKQIVLSQLPKQYIPTQSLIIWLRNVIEDYEKAVNNGATNITLNRPWLEGLLTTYKDVYKLDLDSDSITKVLLSLNADTWINEEHIMCAVVQWLCGTKPSYREPCDLFFILNNIATFPVFHVEVIGSTITTITDTTIDRDIYKLVCVGQQLQELSKELGNGNINMSSMTFTQWPLINVIEGLDRFPQWTFVVTYTHLIEEHIVKKTSVNSHILLFNNIVMLLKQLIATADKLHIVINSASNNLSTFMQGLVQRYIDYIRTDEEAKRVHSFFERVSDGITRAKTYFNQVSVGKDIYTVLSAVKEMKFNRLMTAKDIYLMGCVTGNVNMCNYGILKHMGNVDKTIPYLLPYLTHVVDVHSYMDTILRGSATPVDQTITVQVSEVLMRLLEFTYYYLMHVLRYVQTRRDNFMSAIIMKTFSLLCSCEYMLMEIMSVTKTYWTPPTISYYLRLDITPSNIETYFHDTRYTTIEHSEMFPLPSYFNLQIQRMRAKAVPFNYNGIKKPLYKHPTYTLPGQWHQQMLNGCYDTMLGLMVIRDTKGSYVHDILMTNYAYTDIVNPNDSDVTLIQTQYHRYVEYVNNAVYFN